MDDNKKSPSPFESIGPSSLEGDQELADNKPGEPTPEDGAGPNEGAAGFETIGSTKTQKDGERADSEDKGDDKGAPSSPFETIGATSTEKPAASSDDGASGGGGGGGGGGGQKDGEGEGGDDGPKAPHVRFPGISARAFEHPADRAAMAALRKVPGVDLALRKLIGLVGERSLRYLFLASAVRVSEKQFPDVYKVYLQCCDTLDVWPAPELFIAQTPLVNAGAVGVDKPFIVLNSGTVSLLELDELKVVLGHELGHILSDHVLFKTMLRLLLNISLSGLGIPLGEFALFGLLAALREWDRKSELSCDRAGLLAMQDPQTIYRVHMKLAGGGDIEQMSVDAFVEQAKEYERAGGAVDGIFKLLNLIGRTHPFHVTRLAELKQWAESEGYAALLGGEYEKRDKDDEASVYKDVKDGAREYKESYERSEEPLARLFSNLGEAISDTASNVADGAKGLFDRFGRKK